MSRRFWVLAAAGVSLISMSACSRGSRAFFPSWFGKLGALDSDPSRRKPAQAKVPTGRQTPPISCSAGTGNASEIKRTLAKHEAALGPARFKSGFADAQIESLTLGEWDYLDHVKRVHRDSGRESTAAKLAGKPTGSWLISPDVSMKGCTNLPCLINRVYQKPDDDLIGYMHYSFFLKTGYILNAGNQILSYQDQDYLDYKTGQLVTTPLKISDFLFSKNEHEAFQRWADALPPELKNLPSVVALYRMPKGRAIPGSGAPTCGISRGSWITFTYEDRKVVRMVPLDVLLTDTCLSLSDPTKDVFGGFFFEALTHELGHHLDFSSRQPLGAQFSLTDPWMKESGWVSETGTRKDAEGREEVYEIWKHAPSAKFVSLYAQGNPKEDFADSVAYFRFSPETLEKEAPGKLRILQDRVFGRRSYTVGGKIEQYVEHAVQNVIRDLADLLAACTESSVKTPRDRTYLNLPSAWSADFQNCVQNQIQTVFLESLTEVGQESPDACVFLGSQANRNLVETTFAERLGETMAWIETDRLAEDPDVFSKTVVGLRQRLGQAVEPREVAFDCRSEALPFDCYRKRLDSLFDSVASADMGSVSRSFLDSERSFFRNRRPFPLANAEVNSYFRWILLGSSRLIENSITEKVNSCVSDWEKAGKPRTLTAGSGKSWLVSPFTGRTLNLPGMFLDCMNRDFDRRVSQIFETWADQRPELKLDRAGPIRAEAETILRTDYMKALQAQMEERDAFENQAWLKVQGPYQTELKGVLTGDDSWIPNRPGLATFRKACFDSAKKHWEKWSKTSVPSLTRTGSDFQSQWTGEVCDELGRNAALIQKQDQRSWDHALKDSERLANFYLNDSEASCRKLHRMSKKKRDTCLELSWGNVVMKSVNAWKTSDLGTPFASRSSEVTAYLKTDAVARRLKQPFLSSP